MAKLLLRASPSSSAAFKATVRHLRSRKRLRAHADARLTVRCPVSLEDLADGALTVPAPPPSHVETIRPSAVPKRSNAIAGREDVLSPHAMFVLGLVDGYTPLDDVIAASGLDEADARTLLTSLIARGLVVIA